MSKRTIVSVELSPDLVKDIKSVQDVLPLSKSDIIRLALLYYLKHVAHRLPGASSTEDPYAEDVKFPGCDNCPDSGDCDKCPCDAYEEFQFKNRRD